MGTDKKETLSRSRRFILPFLAMALLCSLAQVIIRPHNPSLVIAYALFMLASLVAALIDRGASAKMWTITITATILAAIAGGIIGFFLN